MSDKDDTCTLSDSDLIDKCHQWISDLAESGGKKWVLRVPVSMNNDPDMLFAELCDRFTGRRPRRPRRPESPDGLSFQNNVGRWMVECFGEEIMTDVIERNYRFFEESLELVQSLGLTKAECLRLVGYVYSRPMGAPAQEVGGVLVTLAALCNASKLNMTDCGAAEINKCWEKIDKIRAKHQSKPQGVRSPLPGYAVESETQNDNSETAAQSYIIAREVLAGGGPKTQNDDTIR